MPLIERLVRLLHPPAEPLDARVPAYARRLTAVWAGLFATMALLAAALAALAVPGGGIGLKALAISEIDGHIFLEHDKKNG